MIRSLQQVAIAVPDVAAAISVAVQSIRSSPARGGGPRRAAAWWRGAGTESPTQRAISGVSVGVMKHVVNDRLKAVTAFWRQR